MRIEAARKLVRGCAREAQRCLEHNIDGGPQNKAPVPQKDRDHAIMGGCKKCSKYYLVVVGGRFLLVKLGILLVLMDTEVTSR